MPNAELEHLRNFAAASRRGGFNVPLFRLDGNTGEYKRTSKQHPDPMNGQILASDPGDLIIGWQRFQNNTPILQVGRAADGYQPASREQLGDLPKAGSKDPWQRVDFLPFWNPESREVLLFTASNQGSRDAIANLVEAYCNNLASHPEDRGKVPLVELATDSYENTHGKQIFIPIFDINDWIERPAAVRRILPPPIKMLDLTALPLPAPAIQAKQSTESSDMDDSIPF
jgi:hypothetical protein